MKINEVVEVTGILSITKPPKNTTMEMEADFECFLTNHPSYLVPRIHCLEARPVSLERIIKDKFIIAGMKQDSIQKVSGLLLNLMKDLCFGDELLTEYLMMSLVSSPTIRAEGLVLGHFPINISNCNQHVLYKNT